MPTDIVRRFFSALPQLRTWIDEYRQRHAAQAQAVRSMGWSRLGSYYPAELLARAKTVSVPSVEFPPLHQFGLPEFAGLQQMSFSGITFKDTYYVRRSYEGEALHFHELVHVVQWARLDVDNFLLAYGVGLLQHSYERAPLERMAYAMQEQFERHVPLPNLMGEIERQTDAIWQAAQPLLR